MPFNFLKRFAAKDIILTTLLILSITSAIFVGWEKVILQITVCVLTAISADLVFNFVKKTKYFFPKAGLITGLIVALVLPIAVSPLIAGFATLAAIFSKQFIKIGRNHIFNPASFGLVTAAILFKIPFGWWGESILWLTILLGLLAVLRAKKELQVIGFVITYIFVEYLFTRLNAPNDINPLRVAFGTAPWFFALFMVPEPMTSLLPYRLTPIFGIIAALMGFGLSFVKINALSDYSLILGLLVANMLAFTYFYQTKRRAKV